MSIILQQVLSESVSKTLVLTGGFEELNLLHCLISCLTSSMSATLPIGPGTAIFTKAGDNALFHMACMMRGQVWISVFVGGVSVDTYVKGSIVLAVECVQER